MSLARWLVGSFRIGLVLALADCANTANLPPAPAEPNPADAFYVTPAYRLRVGDALEIRLPLNPEMNDDVTIRPDGHISTRLVTDMDAANKTVPQLAHNLITAYSTELRDPRISVIVKSSAPTEIFVAGEVGTPGEYTSPGTAPTLSQALARAGGVKMSGDEDRVFIIRRRANDTPEFLSTRFQDIVRAHDASADIRLAPFDVVYVPRTGIAEVYKWYNQHIQQFASPTVNFSYFLNPSSAAAAITH
jgi:polysaccharide export outer membrane protein